MLLCAPCPEVSTDCEVLDPHGLHARPSHGLVAICERFESRIRVRDSRGIPADGRSLIEVLALGVEHGQRVTVTARGRDAAAAISEIQAYFESGFAVGVDALN